MKEKMPKMPDKMPEKPSGGKMGGMMGKGMPKMPSPKSMPMPMCDNTKNK